MSFGFNLVTQPWGPFVWPNLRTLRPFGTNAWEISIDTQRCNQGSKPNFIPKPRINFGTKHWAQILWLSLGNNSWYHTLGPNLGNQSWDPTLGPNCDIHPLDGNFGLVFGTQCWNPTLEPPWPYLNSIWISNKEFKLVWQTCGQGDEQKNKQSDECASWTAVAAKID